MSAEPDSLLNPNIDRQSAVIATRFALREPFRHVVIDDFLSPGFAETLLREFPAFERGNARNESGELGNKSTVERVRKLSTSYRTLDELIKSADFLDLIGRLTGIDGLLYDPFYFGGGTHENREGQDLDPHIDFNRHPIENWHRRLNLIIYLNPEWQDDWGGSLEIHTDPRSAENRIEMITPLFNRCVIFETTETSWHGFSRITLPDARKNLSRRSIALYFYTKDRPADELADTHSTIYVDRALPSRYVAGKTLSDADVEELKMLLRRRDQHNERLYHDITRLSAKLEQARSVLYAGNLGRLRYLARIVREKLRR